MNTTIGTREPHDWWNTVTSGIATVVVFLVFWFSACSSPSSNADKTNNSAAGASTPQTMTQPSTAATSQATVPQSLAESGEYAENIYDYAKANDWKNADTKLAALKDAVIRVRGELKDQDAAVDRLATNIETLERFVTSKDRQATMHEANQVTVDVANMTTGYKLSVPVEVTKLDYYGRELEVWAQAQDANKLHATARDMRQTWDALRPTIEAHSAAEAKTFDGLVARVEAAKTPADYARVATPILNEVDNLEKLFR